MKKIKSVFTAVLMALALTGCTKMDNMTYFRDIDITDLTASRHLHEERIMPKDKLTIYVHTTDPAASRPFNLSNGMNGGGGGMSGYLPYLVDNEGNINFPVLGKLHVQGLTRVECQDMIAAKLKNYLAETETPIVTINLSGFHITILGEVGSVGVKQVPDERVNILEALAMAGDITQYGKRDNVLLIREDEHGEKSIQRIDITTADIINSPYFYLQQNDILYVEPMKVKVRSSYINTNMGWWYTGVGLLSTVASTAALIVMMTKQSK